MPKISAVMALYNTPYDYLKITIGSILNQTYDDFELIIIDDASTMEYEEYINEFNDDRIKYFKLEQNSGPGHARNEGIRKAQGEYVAIVDSDDVYMPNRFKLQSEFLDYNPDISLLGATFKYSNNGKVPHVVENDDDIKVFMLFNSPFANPLVMFRRNIFVENNLFYPENINFAEDYELWVDAMFAGLKMANLNDILMIYTRRKNQLSKTRNDAQVLILKSIYKKILLNIGVDASQNELNLHYDIYCEKYDYIKSSEQVSNWFQKIIKANKKVRIFEEKMLFKKQNEVLVSYEKIKNRLFKIKISNYNLCVNKKLKIYIEKRD